VVVPRTGVAGAVVTEVPGGYRVVAPLPEQGLAESGTVPFDVRVTDPSGTSVSWNDATNKQETDKALGVITLKRAVTSVAAPLALDRARFGGHEVSCWTHRDQEAAGMGALQN